MASWRTVLTLVIVAGGILALMAVSQADENPKPGSSPDRIAQLLARIEQLERRVQTLEGGPQAVQQSTHAQTAADEWVSPAPPASPLNQPQFGIVYQLKRFIPEPPSANQPVPTGAGQKPLTFGDVEIRR
ncbi:MAG: hypothetical protein AABP62_13990 [Planctomycetota bacterium]